jgi:hypothetical protein
MRSRLPNRCSTATNDPRSCCGLAEQALQEARITTVETPVAPESVLPVCFRHQSGPVRPESRAVRSSKVSASLLGIAQGDELKPVYARRSKRDDEKTITAASNAALALKIAAEEADGWHVVKTNKRSVRVAKQKPVDRQLEDDAWCLLYRMGFKELNVDRTFSVQVGPKTPPRQLDVFAKDDETVFIVECTHSRETGPKSVKSLLDKIAAIREEVVNPSYSLHSRDSLTGMVQPSGIA